MDQYTHLHKNIMHIWEWPLDRYTVGQIYAESKTFHVKTLE